MTNEQLAQFIQQDGNDELLPLLWDKTRLIIYKKCGQIWRFYSEKLPLHGYSLDDLEQAIEKEHSKLLRTIHEYCGYLSEAKIGLADFFVEGEYEDAQGKPRPCYLITRKGCDMIANKLTGKKGVLFTAAYVTAFEKMTEQLATTGTQFFPPKATSVS